MKIKLVFFFVLLVNMCFANMASPLVVGTINANALSSKDVSILQEHIDVRIFKGFKTAQFDIEYQINTDVEGGQIPLLFLAKDYKGDFKVWVDDQLVNIKEIPNYIIKPKDSPFANFDNSFDYTESGYNYIKINWTENGHNLYKLDDLKYFETSLKKGNHKIRVSYTANVWVYNAEWVKEYSFRYALAPAAYWKSFGGLTITIINESGLDSVTTNLGNPIEGKFATISNWKFKKLPVDVFEINYQPVIGKLASFLIIIDPFWLMIFFGLLLALFHIWLIYRYRKSNLPKRISWVVIAGGILFPVLILCTYIASYVAIQSLLGEDASTRMGYYFLILGFYPILLVIYLFGMMLVDWLVKKQFLKHKIQE
jgi:hypothetical protein